MSGSSLQNYDLQFHDTLIQKLVSWRPKGSLASCLIRSTISVRIFFYANISSLITFFILVPLTQMSLLQHNFCSFKYPDNQAPIYWLKFQAFFKDDLMAALRPSDCGRP
jgi:hypothetical protein